MPIIKEKVSKNFTKISNSILRDKTLKLTDRGLLSTLCNLGDSWDFSVEGLKSILPDGKHTITSSLKRLEAAGYIEWTKTRDKNGAFLTYITVHEKRKDVPVLKTGDGDTKTGDHNLVYGSGMAVAEKSEQYNIIKFKTNDVSSYSQSNHDNRKNDLIEKCDQYKSVIAKNISFETLLDVASAKNHYEKSMVCEIFDLICQVVSVPRKAIKIKGVDVPWELVKEQYLKLDYDRVADVLNRIVDQRLKIKDMHAYLVTALYEETICGTLAAQASMADEDFQYYRGTPY